ncbi:MAG: VOC family protein [Thermoplasmata archaeon]|nr:VOC family protein [Thermoplasmata archaeon]
MASDDPAATRSFLQRVFRWEFRTVRMPQGEYHSFDVPGGGRGGIRPTQPTEAPSSLSYVRVRDLDRARARVEKAGGTVVLPRVDVPDMGSFFWFKVPGGPILACWQDAPPRTENAGRER